MSEIRELSVADREAELASNCVDRTGRQGDGDDLIRVTVRAEAIAKSGQVLGLTRWWLRSWMICVFGGDGW